MAEIVLFHHALGLTPGVTAFADQLCALGHRVHVPDLFEGRTFDTIEAGVEHAESIGFDEIAEAGVAAVADLPERLVYAGLSLGALPAQKLAQTRPAAQGALLCYGVVPVSTFSPSWPPGVPLQMHLMDSDPWAELDVEVARQVPGAELFIYSGTAHLFADSGVTDFDPAAAKLLLQRTAEFLARLD